MNILKYFILLVISFAFFNVNAQEKSKSLPKRIYTTKKLNKTPVIDGDISDDAWNVVEWSSDFTEKNPDEGTPPTYQTKFKVIYDAKYLYVAIRALDNEPDLIQQRLSRRDGFAGDRVNVIIDSYHDKRTAFVFTTTAAGVKGEEFVSQNGNNWDDSWNPIWYTDAKVDDKGYTVEMKIPFSQLRFGKAKEQIWGFNIIRTIFRLQERSLWQRIPNDQAGFISEAGELHGLIDLDSQKQLEIQPFAVLQYDNYPAEAGNPFRDGSDFKLNGGLDAKIGITNDLTLDLTINTINKTDSDSFGKDLEVILIFGKLLLLINRIYRKHHIIYSATTVGKDHKLVYEVINYINRNFFHEITLDVLAEEFTINKYTLCRIFSNITNISPIKYLIICRLNKAKELLQTDMNIEKVCFECGFNNLSNFSKSFKLHCLISPKSYQMQLRKKKL